MRDFIRSALDICLISAVTGGYYSFRFIQYNRIKEIKSIAILFTDFFVFFIVITALIYVAGYIISHIFGKYFDILKSSFSFGFGLTIFVYLFIVLVRMNLYAIAYDNYPFVKSYSQMVLLSAGFLIFDIFLSGCLAFAGFYLMRLMGKDVSRRFALLTVCLIFVVGINLTPALQKPLSRSQENSFEVKVRSGYPVFLIAVDGADWRVINRYKKHLPTFRQIMKKGTRGHLKTVEPTLSPILWTSILTGKKPDRHRVKGLFYYYLPFLDKPISPPYILEATFVTKKLSEYNIIERIPVNSALNQSTTLYEIFNSYDREVTISGMWPSWHLPSTFKGTAVSFKTPSRLHSMIDKRTKRDIKYKETGKYVKKNDFIKLQKDGYITPAEKIWKAVKDNIENIKNSDDLFYSVFKNQTDSLRTFNFLYLRQTDNAQHKHYSDFKPELFDTDAREKDKNEVLDAFIEADRKIGKLWKAYKDRAIFIIVSDHGHGAIFNRPGDEGYHNYAPPGVFLIAGDPIKENKRIKNIDIFDIAPTILYLTGFPAGKDMDGNVIRKSVKTKYLDTHPVRYIESYEFLNKKTKNVPEEPSESDAEFEEKLKSLGYL